MTLLVPDRAQPVTLERFATRLLGTVMYEDRSLAREVARLHALHAVTGQVTDRALFDAVRDSSTFEVHEQVRLPNGRHDLRPDLSIIGRESGEPKFQLLIEIKLAAKFHTIKVAGDEYPQPAAYVVAWRKLAESDEALVCRVGTLIVDHGEDWRSTLPSPGDGANVLPTVHDTTWTDVLALVASAIGQRLEPDREGKVEPLGPTVLMAWLVRDIHASTVGKRDGRIGPSLPEPWLGTVLDVGRETDRLRRAAQRLNASRDYDEPRTRGISDRASQILQDFMKHRTIAPYLVARRGEG